MRRTNLPGHALRGEGAAYKRGDSSSGWVRVSYAPSTGSLSGIAYAGVALCECGATSPELTSNTARQRWHRDEHKPAVRAQMAEEADRG